MYVPSVVTCFRILLLWPACTKLRSTSYCLPGMRPYRIMTASSELSSIRMSTLCHGVPLTFTERPLARASAITVRFLDSDGSWVSSPSLSSSTVSPKDSSNGSDSLLVSEKDEERMKVAETEVISRTARDNWGVHGRIECHSEGRFVSMPRS